MSNANTLSACSWLGRATRHAFSTDGSGTMTTAQFSISTDRELLVAFVGYDGPANSPQTATGKRQRSESDPTQAQQHSGWHIGNVGCQAVRRTIPRVGHSSTGNRHLSRIANCRSRLSTLPVRV